MLEQCGYKSANKLKMYIYGPANNLSSDPSYLLLDLL